VILIALAPYAFAQERVRPALPEFPSEPRVMQPDIALGKDTPQFIAISSAWYSCAQIHSEEMAKISPSEPTDSIISAALTECDEEEAKLAADIRERSGVGHAEIAMEQNKKDLRDWLRPKVIRAKQR
jgi:hypothetical protein